MPGEISARKIESIKNDILGKNYSLSIAFVDEKKSQEINKKYRGKNKPTNVLSFALRKNEGELVLCKAVIKRELKNKKNNLRANFEERLLFLVIHGMLHLKGLEHSSTMEEAEKFYIQKHDKEYNSRNRRGLINDESHSGRIPKRRKKS